MTIPKSLCSVAQVAVQVVLPLLVGALSAAYVQTVTGWWLNSGKGVVFTVTVLFVLAVVVACWGAAPWTRAASLWIGSMVGLAASLFWMGPGNIWPIVLGEAGGITAVTVLLGSGVGTVLYRATRKR